MYMVSVRQFRTMKESFREAGKIHQNAPSLFLNIFSGSTGSFLEMLSSSKSPLHWVIRRTLRIWFSVLQSWKDFSSCSWFLLKDVHCDVQSTRVSLHVKTWRTLFCWFCLSQTVQGWWCISGQQIIVNRVRPFRLKFFFAYKRNKAKWDPFHMCFTISL